VQHVDAEMLYDEPRRFGNVFECQDRERQAVALTGFRID